MQLNPNTSDQSNCWSACWERGGVLPRGTSLLRQSPTGGGAKSLLSSFPPPVSLFFSSSLLYTGSYLILSLQIYTPVFSLVIKSCQAEAGLHTIIPRSSHIWCSPEESGHNTHHLLSAKYVGEFCRIFTQSHSVPFINYHITKEAHLLCMVCCLGARSNSPL